MLPRLLSTVALAGALAFAADAEASSCAGADPCPWTQFSSTGDVAGGEFRAPYAIAAAPGGQLYVLENDNHRVQKLDASGGFLAQLGEPGEGDGELLYPEDVTVDASGAVYVADTTNNRVVKLDADGDFVAAWGWGVADGGAAHQICTSDCQAGIAGNGADQLNTPRGVATDGTHVYVVDFGNKRIQKFTVDGAPVGKWTLGGEAPQRLAMAGGKVYVTTSEHHVWRFDTSGAPDSSWDGDGVAGSPGAGAGQFNRPRAVSVDGSGVFVADSSNNRVVKLDSSGTFVAAWGWGVADGANELQTCAATCQAGSAGPGTGQFDAPYGVLATGGHVWVADSYNHRLQEFSPAGVHALTLGSMGPGDFYYPTDVAVGASGAVYVADRSGREVEVLDAAGSPQTRWSTGVGVWSITPTATGLFIPVSGAKLRLYDTGGSLLKEFGSLGSGPGQVNFPWGTAADAAGNLYVAESNNDRVQKFDPDGNPLATFGTPGSGDGQLSDPRDVALDSDGNVYVADTSNHRIVKFGPAGNFLAKFGGVGNGDGQLRAPSGITIDSDSGKIYVSDTFNSRIQQFDPAGNFVAKWGARGRGDGELVEPTGLVVDGAGALWVADEGNHRVVRFSFDPGPAGETPSSDPGGAGPGEPSSSAPDITAPHVGLGGKTLQRVNRVRRRGLALRITSDEPAALKLRAGVSRRDARRLGLRSASLARATSTIDAAGTRTTRLRLTAAAQRALLRIGAGKLRIVVRAVASDSAGNSTRATIAITVKR